MIARYTLLLPILLAFNAMMAQGVVILTNEEGEVVNGTVIHKASSPDNFRDTVSVYAELVGNATVQVNVRRYEIWPVADTRNFFCWGVCYTASNSGAQPTWVSQHPIDMEPGEEYNNFHAYYEPQEQGGTARFRYVWFNSADPNGADSSWVDIDFGGAVSVGETAPVSSVALGTWPNPSVGGDVTISHAVDQVNAGTELVIYTVLGERIASFPLRYTEGTTKIPAGSLQTGVYFANLEQNGSVLATKRLLITN